MKHSSYFIVIFLALSIFSCNNAEVITDELGQTKTEAEAIAEEEGIIFGLPNSAAKSYTECASHSYNCENCVNFAACRSDEFTYFPISIYTLADKCRLINKSYPQVGDIAVMNYNDTAGAGHVAYVFYVNSSQTYICVSEGNYDEDQCGTRCGNVTDMNILGYYDYPNPIGNGSCP